MESKQQPSSGPFAATSLPPRLKSPTPALLGQQPVMAAIPVAFQQPTQARAVYSFDGSSGAAAAALLTQGFPAVAATQFTGSTLTAAQHKSALERERERERERDRERDRDRAMGRAQSSGSDSGSESGGPRYTGAMPLRTKRKMRKNNREKQRRSELNDKVTRRTQGATKCS